MNGPPGIVGTSARAAALILLAAAAVIGTLLLLASLLSGAPEQITPEPWSVLNALTGVGRIAFLAALGAAATSAVLATSNRLRKRPSTRAGGSPPQ